MHLTRNLETLTNKASAMNQVNKAILSTAEVIQELLADQPQSIYLASGDLNKKTRLAIRDILDIACCNKMHSIIIDDSHNSVALQYNQKYEYHGGMGQNSTQYYKETVYIVCKGQNTNTERAKYNVRITLGLERFLPKYSGKGLLAQTVRAYKLEEKINKLKNELSSLTFNLKD